MNAQRLAPAGFLTLIDALAIINKDRAIIDCETSVSVDYRPGLEANSRYPGGITWVDELHDERLAEALHSPEERAVWAAWEAFRVDLLRGRVRGYLLTLDGEIEEIGAAAWAAENAALAADGKPVGLSLRGRLCTGHVLLKESEFVGYLDGAPSPPAQAPVDLVSPRFHRKTAAQRDKAKAALKELYPTGVPPHSRISNKALVMQVVQKLEEMGTPPADMPRDTTILRAACRKK